MRCLIAAILCLVACGVGVHVQYDAGAAVFLVLAIMFIMAAADGEWRKWQS